MDLSEVSYFLSKNKALLPRDNGGVNDYPGLRQAVFLLELKQEIEHLELLLKNPDLFIDAFKARCASREIDRQRSMSFADSPSSITNKMYWDIARHLFQPETLQDMLAVIMPGIKKHLSVHIPEQLPNPYDRSEHRNHLKNIEPVLEISENLNVLNQRPDLDDLSHYVISGAVIFCVRDIANFSLRMHNQVNFILQKDYPELAETLYTHNADWMTLYSDLLNFNSHGLTPKESIEQLVLGLTQGGERVSGAKYAMEISHRAVDRFFNYFNALTQPLQEQLKSLRGEMSLNDIFDQYLMKGECVETTAYYLTTLLEQNKRQAILCSSPGMTDKFLKQLEGKYRANKSSDNLLDLVKDAECQHSLPEKLTKKTIQSMGGVSNEQLVIFMMNLPLNLYDSVIQYNALDTIPLARSLYLLAKAVEAGFFSYAQKVHLARVIAIHPRLLNYGRGSLHWAAYSHDLDCFNAVLDALSADQLQSQIWGTDVNRASLLHIAASNFEVLQAALGLYLNKEELNHFSIKLDAFGESAFHYAALDSKCSTLLLRTYPKRKRQGVLMLENEKKQTMLHCSVSNKDALQTLLSYFPSRKDRINALMKKDKDGHSCLHLAANHPQSLDVILSLLSETAKPWWVERPDSAGKTVLHLAKKNPESLKVILSHLVDQARFRALNHKNDKGYTVLDVLDKVKSIIAVLGQLSENEQLLLLKNKKVMDNKLTWQKLLGKGESLIQKDAFLKSSFISTYLSILSYLDTQDKQFRHFSFFNYHWLTRSSPASQLMRAINGLNSFDEIKGYLSKFIDANPEHPLADGLSERLGIAQQQPLREEGVYETINKFS